MVIRGWVHMSLLQTMVFCQPDQRLVNQHGVLLIVVATHHSLCLEGDTVMAG